MTSRTTQPSGMQDLFQKIITFLLVHQINYGKWEHHFSPPFSHFVFIQVLQLHQHYPAELVQQAVSQALAHHCPHLDGVQLCLRQLVQPEPPLVSLDLRDHPKLRVVRQQPLRLGDYDQLLKGGQDGSQLAA